MLCAILWNKIEARLTMSTPAHVLGSDIEGVSGRMPDIRLRQDVVEQSCPHGVQKPLGQSCYRPSSLLLFAEPVRLRQRKGRSLESENHTGNMQSGTATGACQTREFFIQANELRPTRWFNHGGFLQKCRINSLAGLMGLVITIMLIFLNAVNAGPSGMEIDTVTKQTIDNVNADSIRNSVIHLEKFGNRSTWENQWKTAQWAVSELENHGVRTSLQTYEYHSNQWPNVVAEIRGIKKPGEIILVIAHLDSIADNPQLVAPGADDDGSGVAAVLELARIMSKSPLERTLMFCLFTNEETGHAGSKQFAAHAREQALNIQAVLNLDEFGYNLPRKISMGEIVFSHHTMKHKLSAAIKMAMNYWKSIFSAGDCITIGGRNDDVQLVSTVSLLVRQYSDLSVQELSGRECG